jgi:hypothetical protein
MDPQNMFYRAVTTKKGVGCPLTTVGRHLYDDVDIRNLFKPSV